MSSCCEKSAGHPCFSKSAQRWFECVHLPVAPRCNIKCYYCTKTGDCPNENRPGTASKTLAPWQAVRKLKKLISQNPRICVVGISGPGDPLANDQTFETLKLVHREFPHMLKCISTNGLLLAEKAQELRECGVTTVSVTVNAVNHEIAGYIYGWIYYDGEVVEGPDGAAILVRKQLAGIRAADELGLKVKVNSVLIPGINDFHLPAVAASVKKLGASIMNIVPLVPQAEYTGLQPPTPMQLEDARKRSTLIIGQMSNCI